MRLDDQITDEVGALDGRQDEANDALTRLREETGLQLFVVFVDSFGGTPAQQWADETAQRSDLGDRDALLAVATGDRAYAYSFAADFPLSDAQLDDVAATAIEPALSANDWAGAVVGAADGYRAALAGQPVPRPAIEPGDASPGGGGGSGLVVVVVLVALAAVAIAALLYLRRRRPAARPGPPVDPNDPFGGLSTQQLNDRANNLLIEVDDSLRTSERELGLATAEYGTEATSSFTAALASAKAEAAEAFRLRMELEDLPKDDEAGTRRRLTEIIRHGEAADARLDAEADAFDELRQLESTLDDTATALTRRQAELEKKLPAATADLDALRHEFTGPALASVAGNPDEATQRLQFAAAALAKAYEEKTAGRRPAAALSVRAADQALDQTDELLAAIGTVGSDLRAAKDAIAPLLAEVESGLAAARATSGRATQACADRPAGLRAAGRCGECRRAGGGRGPRRHRSVHYGSIGRTAPTPRRRRRFGSGAREPARRAGAGRPGRCDAQPGDPRRTGGDLRRHRVPEHPPRRGRRSCPHPARRGTAPPGPGRGAPHGRPGDGPRRGATSRPDRRASEPGRSVRCGRLERIPPTGRLRRWALVRHGRPGRCDSRRHPHRRC